MNKLLFVFVLTIICANTVFVVSATSIDSLKNELSSSTTVEKIDIYNELSRTCKSPKKAINYGLKALELSQKENEKKKQSISCGNIAYGYYFSNNYPMAIKYFKQSVELEIELADIDKVAKGYNNLGVVSQVIGDYENAIIYFQKSLKIKLEFDDKNSSVKTICNLAVVYQSLGNTHKALEYNQKAIKIYKTINDNKGLADVFNNIGVNYESLNEKNKALEYYNKSLAIKKELNDKRGMANSLNNIGLVYYSLENYDKCTKNFQESLLIRKRINDKYGIASSYINFGKLYLKTNKYNEAKKYSHLALNISKDIGLKEIEKRAYENLHKVSKLLGNYKDAYNYYYLCSAIKDSIFNEESVKRIERLQIKFKTYEIIKENELLNKNIEIQKFEIEHHKYIRNIIIILGILILTILSLIIWIWLYFRKRKEEKKLALLNIELEKRVDSRTNYLEKEINERKKIEEELKISKIKAEENTKVKSQFLAEMSHEIRTPMNGIIGLSEILREEKLTEYQQELLDIIYNSGNDLLRIINDILDVSKIEAGQFELVEEKFDLINKINEVVKLLKIKAKIRNLELSLHFINDVPSPLIGDPVRLNQIIINIVNNALKFTKKGEIKIIIETLEEQKDSAKIKISVKDTGVGINKKGLESIFKAFSTSRTESTKKIEGTGLGLTISKELVKQMQGEIYVESEVGKGSVFWFIVVLKKSIEKTQPKKRKTIKSKLHVLVVEDNPMNQQLLKKVLLQRNYTVEIVANGKIAVEKYKTENFDLVLMDISMPVMDGYQATLEIRKFEKEENKKAVNIVAVTAKAVKQDKQKSLEVGMNDFLNKPFRSEQLFEIIDNLE
ncbi:MAG: tetratricopeptide repeat protein [Bacteroidota bacterium]|nr:tetratricopeptide repeat protein [Bacteroidota bacterium]